ncbi:FYVE zinc finger [Carpediemonas membranifera]|uniref:FYVE zinc finger n=1 Tax=Carpediemonas membranifera TaxID=201153 RepID=A0A8J6ARY2_9EUKA|nr:FYVE zinc finger [Carpediemonas membranifera]|eukprot:KAG9392836.1 FYVE zinc finger [Carpediemonas membranifera]
MDTTPGMMWGVDKSLTPSPYNMAILKKKNDWLSDENSASCMLCDAEFSFFNRRHHCRRCGRLFCNSCMKTGIWVGKETVLERVCNLCHLILSEDYQLKAYRSYFHLFKSSDILIRTEYLRAIRNSIRTDDDRALILKWKNNAFMRQVVEAVKEYSVRSTRTDLYWSMLFGVVINLTASFDPEVARAFIDAGGATAVLTCIRVCEEPYLQEFLVWILRNISPCPAVVTHDADPISTMAAIDRVLKIEVRTLQQCCTAALANLLTHDALRYTHAMTKVPQCTIVTALARLLTLTVPQIQRNAARCVSLVATATPAVLPVFDKRGIIEMVAGLLTAFDPQVKCAAMVAIRTMVARSAVLAARLTDPGQTSVVPALTAIIAAQDNDLTPIALGLLNSMAEIDECAAGLGRAVDDALIEALDGATSLSDGLIKDAGMDAAGKLAGLVEEGPKRDRLTELTVTTQFNGVKVVEDYL